MSEVKLVLADLDGTVVEPEAHTASKAVVESIRNAESRGVRFAAVTGRPFWMTKDLLKSIGFIGPCIFEGGGAIINPLTEEVLWSKYVPAETTRKAVGILVSYASLIEYGSGARKASEIELSSIVEAAPSIWASVPVGDVEIAMNKLRTLSDVAVHANNGPGGDFTRTGIQVTHKYADKEHAVKELLRLFDIDNQHTLAIGDGDNDLPLFRNAGIKVAMGNASVSLKEAADHTVSNVAEDGFAEAINSLTQ